jgi:import inner membrane translocase subunit TIM17
MYLFMYVLLIIATHHFNCFLTLLILGFVDLSEAARIINDIGGAFAIGSIGGVFWHFSKGYINSPRPYQIVGGYSAAQLHGPRFAGNIAVWAAVFAVYDCSLMKIRGKENKWNGIVASSLTGGTLSIRAGLRIAAKNALVCGALLAILEWQNEALVRNRDYGNN